MKISMPALALAALVAATPAPSSPRGSGGPCAPPGFTPPRLFVVPRPGTGRPTLRFDGGQDVALGQAVLFLEQPGGPPVPAGRCLDGLRGRLGKPVQLDLFGDREWSLPLDLGRPLPPLRVIAWAPGGGYPSAVLSNRVHLVLPEDDAERRGGGVVISEFMKDPSFVSDTKGEWVELHNTGPTAVDVEGWVLSDLGSDAAVLDNGGQGIVVPPGGYLVLGREKDPAQNGEVPVDVAYDGFTMSNSDDEIVLSKSDGTVVDLVAYDDGVVWPDLAGRSISLDPGHVDVVDNDDGANWCHGTTPISQNNPDTGTPGAGNDVCP